MRRTLGLLAVAALPGCLITPDAFVNADSVPDLLVGSSFGGSETGGRIYIVEGVGF